MMQRASVSRNMMSKLLLKFAACAALLLTGCGPAPEGSVSASTAKPVASVPAKALPLPAPPPPPRFTGPVLVLTGTSEKPGGEQARQLSTSIHTFCDQCLDVYLGSGARRSLALSAAQLYARLMSAETRAEVDAMSAATGLDDREALLAQCFLDISPM